MRCVRCGVRRHSFWTDPVGELITYLCETRLWADRIVCIARNDSCTEWSDTVDMDGFSADLERSEDNMNEGGGNDVARQSKLYGYAAAKTARSVRPGVRKILVSTSV